MIRRFLVDDPPVPRVVIYRPPPDEWKRVRAIRLRALADAPDAFSMTLAEEVAQPTEYWRRRLEAANAATFLAVVGDDEVGLAVGAPYEGRREDAGLFAMWVAPSARGRKIASSLVDAVVTWAREGGYRRVVLGVADENMAAIRLYESKGFHPTGVALSLPPPREHVREHERALVLPP